MSSGQEYTPKILKHVGKHEAALKAVKYLETTTFALGAATIQVTLLIVDDYLTLNRNSKPGTAAFTGRNKVVYLKLRGSESDLVLADALPTKRGTREHTFDSSALIYTFPIHLPARDIGRHRWADSDTKRSFTAQPPKI